MTGGKYTTALSKGQGMLPETLALLRAWTPGMTPGDLKAIALREGIIGRVTAKCKTDRSLAIAHDREDLYEAPAPSEKKPRKKKRAEKT